MQNQLMVAIFVAVGVTLVAGLIAIPSMEQAFADNGNHGNGGGINT